MLQAQSLSYGQVMFTYFAWGVVLAIAFTVQIWQKQCIQLNLSTVAKGLF